MMLNDKISVDEKKNLTEICHQNNKEYNAKMEKQGR
jgi:hypothetical protein